MFIAQRVHLLRAMIVTFLIGLSYGLNHGLRYGLDDGWREVLNLGLSNGISGGLYFGFASLLISVILERLQKAIYPTERVIWTWLLLRNRLFAATYLRFMFLVSGCIVILITLGTGLTSGYIGELNFNLINGLSNGLSIGLSFGLLSWLLLGLYQNIGQERIEDQDRRVPNQGIRQSLRNSLFFSLISGALIGGMGILTDGLNVGLSEGLGGELTGGLSASGWRTLFSDGLSRGLNIGLSNFWSLCITSIILVWMITGGMAVWRHYLIRFLLYRARTFPWNAPQFLDDATTRILLQRIGGGYRFIHRLLLDFLADAEHDDNSISKDEDK